ncbi:hypothetical protein [Rhodanobacter sp. Soil772]|jgi:hypothetical protein|uniref:hypothetical protein n=1 Tax=Rhodanobacter sp. Soil772 TaxID=1736406 RepID=UPI0012F88D14|nr:hypothetical protein [Rhodanobacter sp. Soil772]
MDSEKIDYLNELTGQELGSVVATMSVNELEQVNGSDRSKPELALMAASLNQSDYIARAAHAALASRSRAMGKMTSS